jgi:hypothetical protein
MMKKRKTIFILLGLLPAVGVIYMSPATAQQAAADA